MAPAVFPGKDNAPIANVDWRINFLLSISNMYFMVFVSLFAAEVLVVIPEIINIQPTPKVVALCGRRPEPSN